jgi:predicted ATP-grasp superfamily ATP-dependent carboligase
MSEDSSSFVARTEKPAILLTDVSRFATAARLAIVLAGAGARVEAVCPRREHFLQKTRAVAATHPYSWFDPLRSLEDAIRASKPALLIPCDDRGVEDLQALFRASRAAGPAKKDIADLIERSLGPAASFPVTVSRHALLELARDLGLRVPASRSVKSVADLDSWRAEHDFPWVLKADGTCGGRGVRIVHTREEAERAFFEITRPPRVSRAVKRLIIDRDAFGLRPWWKGEAPSVIVQEYIDGKPANCAAFVWRGKMLAGIGVEVVGSQNATGPATVVRVVENAEMQLAAERIPSPLKLSGFVGFDFMIEKGTGATYLIEMNPRPTTLCHLQLGPGRDMVAPLYAQLTGTPLRQASAVTENDLIAYFPRAWTFNKELLPSCFQDVPQGEPELIEELLHPARNKRFIFRRLSRRRALKASARQTKRPHPVS